MTEQNIVSVEVHVLGKEYRISCPEDEQQGLLNSAQLLNEKIEEIRAAGRVAGSERIAVMAALNMAHELLALRHVNETLDAESAARVSTLAEKVELALNNRDQSAV